MTITFGVDVSHWQGMIDWKLVNRSGAKFAIIKSSQGTKTRDQYFTQNYTRAKANGMLCAAYHYVSKDDAAQQAQWIKTCLSDAWNTIAVMLDWEDSEITFGKYRAVLKECESLGIRVVMEYIPRWFWQEMHRPDLWVSKKLLVSSRYPSNVSSSMSVLYGNVTDQHWQSYGGYAPTILQFTDRARIPGIKDPADANAFRGTIAELRQLWYPVTPKRKSLVINGDAMSGVVPALVNGKVRIVIPIVPGTERLIICAGFSDMVLNNLWFVGTTIDNKPTYLKHFSGYLVKMDVAASEDIPAGCKQITIETDTTIPWGWALI